MLSFGGTGKKENERGITIIKASYGTQGRPGPFNKNLTVLSNAGSKVLFIKGEVEKAPESSVPQNNSMIKTN
jgi:hypothetical protein